MALGGSHIRGNKFFLVFGFYCKNIWEGYGPDFPLTMGGTQSSRATTMGASNQADVFADRLMTTLSIRTGLSNLTELLPLSAPQRTWKIHQMMFHLSREAAVKLAFKGHTHISTVLVACFTLIVLYSTCIFAGLPNHLTDCCPTLPTEYCLRPQHPFIRNQNHACSSTCHCPRPEISGDFGKRMGSTSLELMVVEANQPGLGYF